MNWLRRIASGRASLPASAPDGTAVEGRITVPDDHEVWCLAPASSPTFYRRANGLVAIDLGASSDEPDAELQELLERLESDGSLRSQPVTPGIILANQAGRLSDLFSPHDPVVTVIPRLVIWILHAGSAFLWLRNPQSLLAAIRRVGAAWPQCAYLDCRVGESGDAAAHTAKDPPGTAALAQKLQETGASVRRVPPDGVCFVEVRRPSAVVCALVGESFAPREEIPGDAFWVARAPGARRMCANAAETGSQEALDRTVSRLLERNVPLVVRSEPNGTLPAMAWTGGVSALPAYLDFASLACAAVEIGAPLSAFAHVSLVELLQLARDSGEKLAIGYRRDDGQPAYLVCSGT